MMEINILLILVLKMKNQFFKCLDKIFAHAISSENNAPFHLSLFVFKKILNYKIKPIDIEIIDIHSYNLIIKILSYGSIEQKRNLYGIINFTIIKWRYNRINSKWEKYIIK